MAIENCEWARRSYLRGRCQSTVESRRQLRRGERRHCGFARRGSTATVPGGSARGSWRRKLW